MVKCTRTIVLNTCTGKSASLVYAADGAGVGWLWAADADRHALPGTNAAHPFAKRHGTA